MLSFDSFELNNPIAIPLIQKGLNSSFSIRKQVFPLHELLERSQVKENKDLRRISIHFTEEEMQVNCSSSKKERENAKAVSAARRFDRENTLA
jgi:hypothetical protein